MVNEEVLKNVMAREHGVYYGAAVGAPAGMTFCMCREHFWRTAREKGLINEKAYQKLKRKYHRWDYDAWFRAFNG
jgi:hypothetical protein